MAKKNEKVNDEVELIDIFDEVENVEKIDKNINDKKLKKAKTKKEKQVEKEEIVSTDFDSTSTKKVVKRKFKTKLLVQVLFCSFSILFIIGCLVFYGNRLIKYYKIYNPKDENGKAVSLIGNHITSGASFVYEGEGLYLINGNYVYKGKEVDNYVKYSNFIWRIVKINEDKSLDLVLDTSINNLKWNSTVSDFASSDISKYLNEEFLKILNKDVLVKTSVCTDIIDDVTKINCSEADTSSFVRLLNIDEFLNSKVDDKTYISDGSSIWLSTRGGEKAWTINDVSLSYADTTYTYYVKPVVTLKNSTQVLDGKGTKEEPYIIDTEDNNIHISDHIKLDKDIWTVYKIDKENIYLTLTNLYEDGVKTYRFDVSSNKYDPTSKYSLAEYLNKDYYESLSYKDKLIEADWYIGEYLDSYSDILKEKVTAKVGLTSVIDFKFDNVNNYYILNGAKEGKIYTFNDGLVESKTALSRSIKPSICIKKAKVKTGSGSIDSPYELEV